MLSASRLFPAACLAALALAACSTKNGAPPGCASNQKDCNGTCIDVTTDPNHCGACELACPAPADGGTAACVSGICSGACAAPLKLCGATLSSTGSVNLTCTDISKDPENCGACGTQCPPQQACVNGACSNCPAGQLDCPTGAGLGACRAVLSDPNNCGGCGNVCGAGSHCDNGVCVSGAQVNCGDVGGGPANLVDTANDPKNCGGCARPDLFPADGGAGVDPHVCQANEACKAGDCVACGATVCNNVCTDTSIDSQNCGACGTKCTGTNVCVAGACASPIRVSILPPYANGVAPVGTIVPVPIPLARVDSLMPIGAVTLDVTFNAALPDGGPLDGGHLALTGVGNPLNVGEVTGPGGASTFWGLATDGSGLLTLSTADAGTHLSIKATDVAFQSDAGDAPLHSSTAAVDVFPQNPPPSTDGGTMSLTVAFQGGTVPDAGSAFIPLNAGPISFNSSINNALMTQLYFGTFALDEFYLSSTLDAGVGNIVVNPADITANSTTGAANVAAVCGADSLGQSAQGAQCALSPPLYVGRIPYPSGGSPPIMTALADGGSPSVVYATDGGSLVSIDPRVVLVGNTSASPLPTTSSFTGYSLTSLVPAETSGAVLATKADGSSIDRFDCASGTCTRTTVVNGPSLGNVITTTGKAMLIQSTAAGAPVVYAIPSTSPVNTQAAGAGGTLVTPSLGGSPWATMSNGAIVAAILTGTSVQITLAHPSVGVQRVGAAFVGTLLSLTVKPTGEIAWHQNVGGTITTQGAFFDGTNTPSVVTTPLTVAGGFTSWTRAKSKILVGVGPDASQVPRLIIADLGRKIVYAPAAALSNVGPIQAGVRDRTFATQNVVVSDDQLKLLWISHDTLADQTTTNTLWLTDIATGDVAAGNAALASSSRLVISALAESADWYPHFVHTAAGIFTVTEGTDGLVPFGSTPHTVVWAEQIITPNRFQAGVRPSFAVYGNDNSLPVGAVVDRLALGIVGLNQNSEGIAHSSAAASAMFFYDFETLDLYTVPFVKGSGTSQRVAELPFWFGLREDTGRFSVVRGDGVLLTTKVQAGVNPAGSLTQVAEGLQSGFVAIGAGRPGLQLVGYTPDGDHLYAFGQLGGDLIQSRTLATAVLQTFDLRAPGTPPRVDWGRAQIDTSAFDGPQACFVSNAAMAILARPANLTNSLEYMYFAESAGDLGNPLDLGVAPSFGTRQQLPCSVAADGSEAMFTTPRSLAAPIGGSALTSSPNNLAAVAPGSRVNPPVTSLSSNGLTGPSARATFSPFGAPYLDEYDLVPVTRTFGASTTFTQSLFKVWGESSSFPFVTVNTSFSPTTLSPQTRPTDLNAALLYHFIIPGDTSGAFVYELPLAGKPVPLPPLP